MISYSKALMRSPIDSIIIWFRLLLLPPLLLMPSPLSLPLLPPLLLMPSSLSLPLLPPLPPYGEVPLP